MNETTTALEPLYLQAANPYASPRNVTREKGRIIFSQGRGRQAPGWWGPGGLFTTSEQVAIGWAEEINRICARPASAATT
jgi:hypothetical protein